MNNLLRKLPFPRRLSQKGQSLIILAFSFVGLVAFLGLALDLGLFYIERTALKRTIDAAVLSGVTELGNEEEAAARAIDYIRLNGYDINESNIYIRGCIRDVNDYFNDSTGAFNTDPSVGGNPVPGVTQIVNPPEGVPANNPRWAAHPGYYPYSMVRVNNADLPDTDSRVRNIFLIDTYGYQSLHTCSSSPVALGDANKIAITGTVKVDMNFMQIVPPFMSYIMAVDHAVAQNMDSLDVVVVLDRSGSMEFDPVCYNCWKRKDKLSTSDPNYLTMAQTANDVPRYSRWWDYPENGIIYPIPFTDVDRYRACSTSSFDADGAANGSGNKYNFALNDSVYKPTTTSPRYIIMEAELYGLNPAPVDATLQQQGKGYWAMQRGEGNYTSNTVRSYSNSIDGTSVDATNYSTNVDAHMAVHPATTLYDGTTYGKFYSLADAQSGNSPWLEYDFRFYSGVTNGWTSGNTAYIWARVHANRGLAYNNTGAATAEYPWYTGYKSDGTTASELDIVYWGLVRSNSANTAIPTGVLPDDGSSGITTVASIQTAPKVNTGAINNNWNNNWHWVKIGNISPIALDTNYRLYFYAGSAGYSIDRIIITDNPSANSNTGTQDGSALGNARTAPVTASTANRTACDICNPIYGQNLPASASSRCSFLTDSNPSVPMNNALNPLFADHQAPLRASKEAIKFFATQLDPKRDQLGFVSYSGDGINKTELNCKRAESTQGIDCASTNGTNPYTYTLVLRDIESVTSKGGTPTSHAMVKGLEVLGYKNWTNTNFDTLCDGSADSSCSRGGGAQKVMILMTDGMPNSTGWDYGCSSTNAPQWAANNTDDYRCPLYFAQQAAEAGISVYTIGLGFGVSRDYLKEIANYGNGQAYFSASGGDLKIIFNQILSNIYVRLVE